MIETIKPPLTAEAILHTVREVFPGADIQLQPFTGGTIVRTVIWQFTMDISLTTKSIVYGEKEGGVRMTLQWKPPEGKMINIKGGGTTEMGPIKAFARQTRAYLEGVVAAITIACEEPPGEPDADLI